MDLVPWLSIHNVLHVVEEFKLPVPSSRIVMYSGIAAIPVAVLLHDTCDVWMPKSVNIPIISHFARRWRKDSDNKVLDLSTFRNALIFAWIVAAMSESEGKAAPMDYIVERLTNSSARKAMTNEIMTSRKTSFGTATQFAMTTSDPEKAVQLRDAALRRRHVQDERAQLD